VFLGKRNRSDSSVGLNQARQAYLSGNKALAKELSAKGQWHNEQMKAAHSKAGEAIFWQRYHPSYDPSYDPSF
jgi:hypothetical protein